MSIASSQKYKDKYVNLSNGQISRGEESVIMCRDRKGKVHVFLNSCRHRGMKVYRYFYEQGLGYEKADFEVDGLKFPGLVTNLSEAKSSEDNLRNLYRRWADFMDADSWDTLANWRLAIDSILQRIYRVRSS